MTTGVSLACFFAINRLGRHDRIVTDYVKRPTSCWERTWPCRSFTGPGWEFLIKIPRKEEYMIDIKFINNIFYVKR